jgi:hypothetical protein
MMDKAILIRAPQKCERTEKLSLQKYDVKGKVVPVLN